MGSAATSAPLVVLASASIVRHRLLLDAGVACVVDPADIDESALKDVARREGVNADEAARRLAEAKAAVVASRQPGCLVVGADQILDCDGRWLDKPADRVEARENLWYLRDRRHRLVTAVALARDHRIVWSMVDAAVLQMRRFSEAFLDAYLAEAGDTVFDSVGACKLEGAGIQFFERVEGDFFTILGLPLLPLLEALRSEGLLPR